MGENPTYYMLLDGTYPQDIRVRKEAESLVEAGVAVAVITRWQKGLQREEIINGVKVHRIGKDYTHSAKGWNDILTAITFIDRAFFAGLKLFVDKHKITFLHVHDLPLVATARKVLGKSGKIVLDMHENFPEMLEELNFSSKGIAKSIKDKLFFSNSRWKKYEAKVIHEPIHIIAVIDEMKEKLRREYGLPERFITVISNYEKTDFASVVESDDFNFDKETFYLAYIGGISPVRGLELAIDGVAELIGAGEKLQFLIIGGGNSSYIAGLQQRVRELKMENYILFPGYKNFKKINYYIENVQVNIIPHVKNEHTDHTIPHKLFQIMMQKAPLLVSSCKPMKRILEENNAGFVFEAGNIEDFKRCIRAIKNHPDSVNEKVENAYKLVKNKYNWENEGEKLAKLVRSFDFKNY